MPYPRVPLEERFWSKVRKGRGCWEWQAAKAHGYGVIGKGGKGNGYVLAHRAAWVLAHGPIPRGLLVCHRCDNPSCVRLSHLFLGTYSDNVRDMLRKGRRIEYDRRSSRNPNARIDAKIVRRIRRLHACGLTQRAIGERVSTSCATVSRVLTGIAWRDVE